MYRVSQDMTGVPEIKGHATLALLKLTGFLNDKDM